MKVAQVAAKLAVAVVIAAVLTELAARILLPNLAWLDVLQPTAWGYTARSAFSGNYTGMPGALTDAPFSTAGDGTRSGSRVADAEVVAIGNSFTFGLGVRDDQTWPASLARQSTATVANLGLPGLDMAMALAKMQSLGPRLKGKTVVWVIASDDTRRTPRDGWLAVRTGAARWSQAIAWYNLMQLPKGADLSRDPAAKLDVERLLKVAAHAAGKHGYRLAVVRLSPWRGIVPTEIRVIDLTSTFESMRTSKDYLAEDGIQLNAKGNRRIAEAIAAGLRAR